MSFNFQPKLLHDAYSRLTDTASFDVSREASAATVVSWRFATGDMSIAEPFRKELYGDNSKWKREYATPGKRDLRHGFDASDRLRVVETQDGEHICHLEYADAFALRFGHSPPIPNKCVRRFDFDRHSQIVSHHILYETHGCQHEYTWENGILRSVESISWMRYGNHALDGSQEIAISAHLRQDYVYDDLGLFQIVDRYLDKDGQVDINSPGSVQFTRIPAGETPASLASKICDLIVQETPQVVGKAASKDDFYYALLICYCSEDPTASWPPFILLANESIFRTKNWSNAEAKYFAWAPDELREMSENVEIHFDDPALLETCALHSQVMLSRGVSSMKLALRQIVASLREVEWSKLINTTDDFVIASVDNTGAINPAKEIRAQSPEVFQRLKSRGKI